MPVTGGSNIPALNYLLASWGIALTDEVYEGDFTLADHPMHYATGASLGAFPEKGVVFRVNLNDLGNEMIEAEKRPCKDVPILGLLQTGTEDEKVSSDNENLIKDEDSIDTSSSEGRIVVYGDSNCLDNSHLQKDCFWLLDAILEYTMNGHTPKMFLEQSGTPVRTKADLPVRMENTNLYKHSKVN